MGCAYPGSIPVLPLLQVFQVSPTGLGVSSTWADMWGTVLGGFLKEVLRRLEGGGPQRKNRGGYPSGLRS